MTMLTLTKRLTQAALIASLALPMAALLPASGSLAISKAQAATTDVVKAEASTIAEFKAVLAKYGNFASHPKYGEIWIPTVTPQGWHPYPACQWVYTKDGWYFNDDTPWGSIVHHYGRWSHDDKIGWFWVADEDWSPGWVVWRKSDKWVGWAPMPPEQDSQLVTSPEFNNDKLWTFMEAQKFFNGQCGGTTVRSSQVFNQTQYVTIFDLPPGLLVEIVFVPKWKIKVITKFVTIIIDRICPPTPRPIPDPKPPRYHPWPTFNPSPTKSGDGGTKPGIKIDVPPRAGGGDGKPRIGVIDIPLKPGTIDIPVRPGKPERGGHGGGHGGKPSHGDGRGVRKGTIGLGHLPVLGSRRHAVR
jgi:uncharacterized protein DUF6600